MARVFISYSWDDEQHQAWVRSLAERLRADGIDARIDQWGLVPGNPLTQFMETEIREADNVLIICTPRYKEKSGAGTGGVGYDEDIVTAQLLVGRNHRKFIPILRVGEPEAAIPASLSGKQIIDLRNGAEDQYQLLLGAIEGGLPKAP